MMDAWALAAWMLSWLLFWVSLHALAVPLALALLRLTFASSGAVAALRHEGGALPWDKRVYLRRLLRSQVYYVAASAAGVWLLFVRGQYPWLAFLTLDRRPDRSEDPLHEMLLSEGGDVMRVVFIGAIAHWLLATAEDWAAWRYLLQHSAADDRVVLGDRALEAFSKGMLYMYTVHHVVTMGAFLFYVCTLQLSVLCCMGLLFELPVCLTNLRELSVGFDVEARSCCLGGGGGGGGASLAPAADAASSCLGLPRSRCWWSSTAAAVVVGRYGSILAYLWTLLFWGDELRALPGDVRVLFHVFGSFFSVLNVLWSLQLIAWWESDRYCLRRTAR